MSACIEKVLPRSNYTTFPFSDGGEGALDTLVEKAAGKLIFCDSVDAGDRAHQLVLARPDARARRGDRRGRHYNRRVAARGGRAHPRPLL